VPSVAQIAGAGLWRGLRFCLTWLLAAFLYLNTIGSIEILQYENNGNWGRSPVPIDVPKEVQARYRAQTFDPCSVKNPNEVNYYLDSVLHPKIRNLIISTEFGDIGTFHFGLGVSIRNTMCLWRGGPLSDWFKSRGVDHPDEMSRHLLNIYWAHLAGCNIDTGEYMKFNVYKEFMPRYGYKIRCNDDLGHTYYSNPEMI
jgi:hypothetical protein